MARSIDRVSARERLALEDSDTATEGDTRARHLRSALRQNSSRTAGGSESNHAPQKNAPGTAPHFEQSIRCNIEE